ncbi:Hsp70 family protein [Actinoplanes subglobosus]|uniref:Hsp70 family protein n=1 Tax=Actinoplanes subglobosus TaxID=1547892 RepID=A0ABV8J0B9_9ACTN
MTTEYGLGIDIGPGGTVVVHDLGGATFDVAVLRREGAGFVLLGTPGSVAGLAGSAFDEAVLTHVLGRLDGGVDRADPETAAALARLRRDCVEAKEALSSDTEVSISVALPGRHARVRLSRAEFETMIAPLVRATVEVTRQALRSAGVAPGALDAVLATGGSARIPMIARVLAEEFGRPVVVAADPGRRAAIGAAWTAAVATPAAPAWGPPVPARQDEFTDLRTPADPWSAAEAAEAAAADAEAAAVTTTPIVPAPRVPAEAGTSTHVIAPPAAPGRAAAGRKRRGAAVAAGAAVLVLAAGGGVGLSYLFDRDTTEAEAGPKASASTEVSAVPADGPPTAVLLIRADVGAAMSDRDWKPKIQFFAPGETTRQDLAGTQPGDVLPRWSFDRKQIALTHRSGDDRSIHVMNADGSARRILVDGVAGGRVAWSADGTRLAFVKPVDGVNQLFVIPVTGGTPTQLTRSKNPKDDPVWSPDGRSVIYWAEAGNVRSIYELNVAVPSEPGRRITRASDGDAVDPAVSPDGRSILYTRQAKADDNTDIWLIATTGDSPARPVVETPEREMDPSWAPDNDWFAFVRGDLDHPRVVIKRRDGTGEQALTTGNAREGHPCWF